MSRSIIHSLAVALLVAPLAFASAEAQGRGNSNGRAIPPGHLPAAGECRVWYDNLPPGRQPRATSCRDAERTAARSRNARVIYGGDRDGRRDSRIDRRDDTRGGRIGGVFDRRGSDRTLPQMPRVSDLRRNRIASHVQRQIRGTAVRATYQDRNRDGRPERVVFYDRRGRALETWYDLRGNGRADRIVVHRN